MRELHPVADKRHEPDAKTYLLIAAVALFFYGAARGTDWLKTNRPAAYQQWLHRPFPNAFR